MISVPTADLSSLNFSKFFVCFSFCSCPYRYLLPFPTAYHSNLLACAVFYIRFQSQHNVTSKTPQHSNYSSVHKQICYYFSDAVVVVYVLSLFVKIHNLCCCLCLDYCTYGTLSKLYTYWAPWVIWKTWTCRHLLWSIWMHVFTSIVIVQSNTLSISVLLS